MISASAMPAEGRGRRILAATVSIALARVLSIVVPLLTIPWALNHLGVERFGMWMAASSLIPLLSFLSGGLGNAVLNAVSRANARDDSETVQRVIASSLAMGLTWAAILSVLGAAAAFTLPWDKVFGLTTTIAKAEVGAVVLVVAASIAGGMVVDFGNKIRAGLQQIPAVARWEAISALTVIPGVLLAVWLDLSTAWLVMAVVLLPILVKALGLLVFFSTNAALRPRTKDFDIRTARELVTGGGMFFVATLAHAIAVASDQILIANILGASAVADYAIVVRLFSIPLLAASLIFSAQWPVYTEASVRGDWLWIRRTFGRTLIGAALFAAAISVGILFFFSTIVNLWIGNSVHPSPLLVLAGAVYAVVVVVVSAFQNLMFSLDKRRTQITLSILMAITNVVLTVLLLRIVGAAGAIIATDIAYLLCLIGPYCFITWKMLHPNKRGSGLN